MRLAMALCGGVVLASCSPDQPANNAQGISFARAENAVSAADEALAPEARPAAADPDPVETGTPPAWAGRYAGNAGDCAAKGWTFSGAAARPPDGRLCRIGQISEPSPGKITLLLRCDGKAGATNEMWAMDTHGGGLSIERDAAGTKDRVSLSRC